MWKCLKDKLKMMKCKKFFLIKLTVFLLSVITFSKLYLFPVRVYAQNPEHEIFSVLKEIQEQNSERVQLKQADGRLNRFSSRELRLDFPSDTLLAECGGRFVVYVDEFNQRAKPAAGEDRYQARCRVLQKIIDDKLLGALACEEGFENDPGFIKRVQRAETKIRENRKKKILEYTISDFMVRQYYKVHMEKFKQPDRGTLVRFIVKGELKEARTVLEKVKQGEPFTKFSFSTDPVPGFKLPVAVREKIFYLEPGQTTEVVATPIGFYIAKLVERNTFDHFKVSAVVKSDLSQCRQVLKKIEGGEKFEAFVHEKSRQSVALKDLPEEVQAAVPTMELYQVSQPIATSTGYFLVKLQERWTDAKIIAKLIKLTSSAEGEEILSRLKKGYGLGDLKEVEAAGKSLPFELMKAAKSLKEGEYSYPVKTRTGEHYLIKVQKRARRMYRPFEAVKKEVKKLIRTEEISDTAAYKYYGSYKNDYRKSAPEFMADIILAETPDKGEKILAELRKVSDENEKKTLFGEYRKDLKSVPAEILPEACQNAVRQLKPGELSPVITTELGYFILQLREKVDPAYLAFGDVKNEIKRLLVKRIDEKKKREAQLDSIWVQETALRYVFYEEEVTKKFEYLSEEEAEAWWQENSEKFFVLGIPELRGDKIKFSNREEAMEYKKRRLLIERFQNKLQDFYKKNKTIIYDDLLT